VIRRRVGEAILVGDAIEIAVIEISPTRVKLGITASKAVSVTRKEMVAVADDNRRAARFVGGAGPAGLQDILRMLNAPQAGPGKTLHAPADKRQDEGTTGIALDRENPNQA
jgi:carbon storage regulator